MEAWYTLVSVCQRQGVDVMSAARMIAWATELYENGVIDKTDTGGIELTWGSREAVQEIIRLIAANKGFGGVLASNVLDAAAKIGKGVEEALNIKGVPLGGTNVMNFRARTAGAVVNPRGSDEYRGRMGSFDNLGTGKDTGMTGMAIPDSWEAKTANDIVERAKKKAGIDRPLNQHDATGRGEIAALANRYSIVSDSLGQCKWNTLFLNVGISIEFQAKALSAGLGKTVTVDDLLEIASRISTQERCFAIRGGVTREDDTIPKKLVNHKMAGTWPEDRVTPDELELIKDDFYTAMGWDSATGRPTGDTLKALGLEDLAPTLNRKE